MIPMHIQDDYFEWMLNMVCDGRYSKRNSYRKLLTFLNDTEFTCIIHRDINRADDGKDLRWRFSYSEHVNIGDALDGPCSVLEMILALALRCEECIMDDPSYGNRTSQWFWKMINNLGLGSMIDDVFDEKEVSKIISRFLNRKYDPDGRGGLFTVRNCKYDMRDVEIWTQLNWFLDGIS